MDITKSLFIVALASYHPGLIKELVDDLDIERLNKDHKKWIKKISDDDFDKLVIARIKEEFAEYLEKPDDVQ